MFWFLGLAGCVYHGILDMHLLFSVKVIQATIARPNWTGRRAP
jgi:hypothetical protein